MTVENRCPVCVAMARSEELMNCACQAPSSLIEGPMMDLAHKYLGFAITLAQTKGHDEECPRLADILRRADEGLRRQKAIIEGDGPTIPGSKKMLDA